MRISVLIIMFVTIIACNKNDFEPDFSNGRATALKDNENWEGVGRGTNNNTDLGFDMYYDVFNELGIMKQRLSFIKIPREIGDYKLYMTNFGFTDSLTNVSFFTFSHDGDVIEDIYILDEEESANHIEVISINTETNWITGEFNATFIIDPDRGKTNPDNPDVIRFESGEFEVKVEE